MKFYGNPGSEREYYHPLTNPLLVDLILNKVMAYLPREDLWTAREVCYKWNEYATSELLSRRTQKSLYFQENMDTFLETMKNSFNASPFVNFSLCMGRFTTTDKIDMLGKFFTTCGPELKKLELQMDRRIVGVNFQGSALPQNNQPLKELDSLEKLKMWYDNSIDEFVGQGHLTFLNSFLTNEVPNLKSLIFFNYSLGDENQVVTDLLCIAIAENSFPYLHQMNLQGKITNENLKILSKSKNKLKNIELLFKNLNIDSEFLEEYLESQKSSVETLKISGPKLCRMPQLQNLISLDLYIIDVSANPFCHENRNKFPRLKKIKLAASMLHSIFQTPQRISAFPSVEKLHFYKHLENSPTDVIPNISIFFPNLKKLRLKFTPQWITSVFENLVNLEELFVDENNLVSHEHDSVFTGIPPENFNDLLPSATDAEVDFLRTKASLANLKKLKIFKLINLNRSLTGSKCTDLTGYFVFLRMPNLESVVTYLNGFSEECLTEMRKKFDITSSLDYLRRKQI